MKKYMQSFRHFLGLFCLLGLSLSLWAQGNSNWKVTETSRQAGNNQVRIGANYLGQSFTVQIRMRANQAQINVSCQGGTNFSKGSLSYDQSGKATVNITQSRPGSLALLAFALNQVGLNAQNQVRALSKRERALRACRQRCKGKLNSSPPIFLAMAAGHGGDQFNGCQGDYCDIQLMAQLNNGLTDYQNCMQDCMEKMREKYQNRN